MGLFNLHSLFSQLTIEEIEKRVSQSELWIRYLGHCNLNVPFKVPACLRGGKPDNNPSGTLFISKQTGDILLHDHSYHKAYNVYTYLKQEYNLDLNGVLLKINSDFNLKIGKYTDNKNPTIIQKEKMQGPPALHNAYSPVFKTSVNIEIEEFVKDKYSDRVLEYFNQYGISEDTLKFFEVLELTGFKITNSQGKEYTRKSELPIICYTEYGIEDLDITNDLQTKAYKLYFPFEEKSRFITNASGNCISGAKQLILTAMIQNYACIYTIDQTKQKILEEIEDYYSEQSLEYPLMVKLLDQVEEERFPDKAELYKTIITTKSFKDMMAWWELGLFAVAFQSEYSDLKNPSLFTSISYYFRHNILNFDNDEVGVTNASKLVENAPTIFNKEMVFVPNGKDISGYIKENGIEKGKQIAQFIKETFKSK